MPAAAATSRPARPEPQPNQRLPRLPVYNDPARPELLNKQQISSSASLGWWDELNLDEALAAVAESPEPGVESAVPAVEGEPQ